MNNKNIYQLLTLILNRRFLNTMHVMLVIAKYVIANHVLLHSATATLISLPCWKYFKILLSIQNINTYYSKISTCRSLNENPMCSSRHESGS